MLDIRTNLKVVVSYRVGMALHYNLSSVPFAPFRAVCRLATALKCRLMDLFAVNLPTEEYVQLRIFLALIDDLSFGSHFVLELVRHLAYRVVS